MDLVPDRARSAFRLLYRYDQVSIVSVNLLGQYLAFAIVAVSLDLVWGYAGLLCLCQALFFCLGGYAMGMYLAHHGGPEGIIDHNGWKLPACLYVVYPYKVGEQPSDALVPWFWKPLWSLWSTLILGVLIPGAVAGVIGFFVFRSRVRGVFFAVLTQAITLAAWLIFTLNDIKCGGTNGLTRFDRVILGSQEKVQVQVDPKRLETGRSARPASSTPALEALRPRRSPVQTCPAVRPIYLITVPNGTHPWKMTEAVEALRLDDSSGRAAVRLSIGLRHPSRRLFADRLDITRVGPVRLDRAGAGGHVRAVPLRHHFSRRPGADRHSRQRKSSAILRLRTLPLQGLRLRAECDAGRAWGACSMCRKS